MSSKREEERNEKIIRGLMKLPPNRKCINCNSLGPQYVCTNFWIFVCMTCSGIHREFTHRVKSVSMSKFTSQEVEALQKGGNQRARETYLAHWDIQGQKPPNCSNAEKIREFIKHVYVDKKYAAGKASDKPPRETQNLGHPEEERKRASSYHSYSQSPPYDCQYEERRYGRQLPVLTRKPGSDRGLYEGKVSHFSSPSRFSDQTLERSRGSDFSVSSPCQSPNFQRDGRVTSPPYQTTDKPAKENFERVRHPQRTTSSGSFGSFDSNSLSFKSNNSVTLADLVSAPEQTAEIVEDKQYDNPSLQQSTSGKFGGLDLFEASFAPHNVTPSPAIDLFQLPEAQSKASVDLFDPSSASSIPNVQAQKASDTTPSSLNFFFQMPQQAPHATMSKSLDEVIPKNEGWATFDFPQHMSPNLSFADSGPPGGPPNGGYIEKVDPPPVPMTTLHWPLFEGSNAHESTSIHNLAQKPTSTHNQWHGEPYKAPEPNGGYLEKVVPLPMPSTGQWQPLFEDSNAHKSMSMHNLALDPILMNNQWHGEQYKSHASFTNTQQSWNAFEDPARQLTHSSTHHLGQEVGQAPFATMNQHLGDVNQAGFERVNLDNRPPISSVPFHVEAHPHVIERKSSNPFELSDDCDFDSGSMYLNMTSLQAALPSGQLPNSFVDDVTQSWFAHNSAPHYIPATQQGALGYMGGPAPNAQMQNVPAQEPVVSVGGNPFA